MCVVSVGEGSGNVSFVISRRGGMVWGREVCVVCDGMEEKEVDDLIGVGIEDEDEKENDDDEKDVDVDVDVDVDDDDVMGADESAPSPPPPPSPCVLK